MTVSVPESYSNLSPSCVHFTSFYLNVEMDNDETLCICCIVFPTHDLINLPSGLREGSDKCNAPTLANEETKE